MNMGEYFTNTHYQIEIPSFYSKEEESWFPGPLLNTRKSLPQLVYNWEYPVHQLLSDNWKVKTLKQENAVVSLYFFYMNHI